MVKNIQENEEWAASFTLDMRRVLQGFLWVAEIELRYVRQPYVNVRPEK